MSLSSTQLFVAEFLFLCLLKVIELLLNCSGSYFSLHPFLFGSSRLVSGFSTGRIVSLNIKPFLRAAICLSLLVHWFIGSWGVGGGGSDYVFSSLIISATVCHRLDRPRPAPDTCDISLSECERSSALRCDQNDGTETCSGGGLCTATWYGPVVV